MRGKVAVVSSAAARRQPLLTTAVTPWTTADHRFEAKNGSTNGGWSRVGETAGECAAVCCCCPCGMVHLLILAVYRLPAGLWRKKRRERLLRKKTKFLSRGKENQRKTNSFRLFYMDYDDEEEEDCRGKNDDVDWDNEMLDRFYWAGFWRSGSQRGDDQ
ncbi:hypothetical protein Salat_0470000 [Sesamum alatum]|uniref:Uncharacterized protein n=1 Tax=Sesamum alatum TaxID=300844 RepID=A0AAE2D0I3_9LAMI|nr:hypothetical protein Salat_0470000 [Sesamum alatum]